MYASLVTFKGNACFVSHCADRAEAVCQLKRYLRKHRAAILFADDEEGTHIGGVEYRQESERWFGWIENEILIIE